MADPIKVPSAREVEALHENSDKDGSHQALHHTLGAGRNQASPGDHSHDGGTSKLLLEGVSIIGSKGDGAALNSVINILVTHFGATDATSP